MNPSLRSAKRLLSSTGGSFKPEVFTAAIKEGASPSSSPSLLSSFFHVSTYQRVNLDTPLSKLPRLREPDASSSASQVSTLKNGIRVVTMDSSSPLSHISIYTDAGARYETNELAGLTNFMEKFIFKSTQNRTEARMIADMNMAGATLGSSSNRESFVLRGHSLVENYRAVLGSLADVIQFHLSDKIELKHALNDYGLELEQILKKPDVILSESIHEAAYFGNTLGKPLYASPASLANFSPEIVSGFLRYFFDPSRLVISASGVDHATFAKDCEEAFQYINKIDNKESPVANKNKAQYTGGEVRISNRFEQARSGLVDIALGFETASMSSSSLIPMNVLTLLLGGGSSFSAGGPGKGLYSRLYTNVLNQFDFIENVSASNLSYTDSGLFLLSGSCHPQAATKMCEILAKEAQKTMSISAEELSRAKTQLKLNYLLNAESTPVKIEDLGRQISISGKQQTVEEVVQAIDNVTVADVENVAKSIFSTPLSLAAYGDIARVPRYDQIQKLFQ